MVTSSPPPHPPFADHLESATPDHPSRGPEHVERRSRPTTEPEPPHLRAEAQRWVRRLRVLYTILGIYAALSLMWFAIDMADGTESLWFYWPMLGTGLAVAVTAIVLIGIGGLFGADWETQKGGALPPPAPRQGRRRVPGAALAIDEQPHRERPQGGHTMKIGIVDVFVDDQDRARDFYTAMLGLEVKVDAAYGESGRWLTVVSPQERDGTALLLAPLNDAAKALRQPDERAARRPCHSSPTTASAATGCCSSEVSRSCPSLGRGLRRESTPCSRTAAAICSTCTRSAPPQAAPKPPQPGRTRPACPPNW